MNLDRDIVFLDTETLGLERTAPIWEFAAVRLHRFGAVPDASLQFQIVHQQGAWLESLPELFVADYQDRYDAGTAWLPNFAAREIRDFTADAVIAGSNPAFDMERIDLLMAGAGLRPHWHYHPLDIPSMVAGYFTSGVPNVTPLTWRSSDLSRLIGVEPDDFARHTAMGDVQWCLAQWRQMTGGDA